MRAVTPPAADATSFGAGGRRAAVTRAIFASASTIPSRFTSVIVSSDAPCAPAGRTTLRFARAFRGTAQDPGPMAWPSERVADGGRPRIRMKLLLSAAPAGVIWIGSRVVEAGATSTGEAGTRRAIRCSCRACASFTRVSSACCAKPASGTRSAAASTKPAALMRPSSRKECSRACCGQWLRDSWRDNRSAMFDSFASPCFSPSGVAFPSCGRALNARAKSDHGSSQRPHEGHCLTKWSD